ncbi:MAG TPA: 50S ribosomal protein L22 [Phycisphaerae bacterium]|nr:50S ribosomal protein L22 [Phycisphaerae bacterium]HNU44458.1 50S ribosomal protein L22 [Phycisphaerae bacterium]
MVETMRVWTAKHRFARVSPRKVRLVIGLIRGRACGEALEQLRFTPGRSVRMIRDVLKSAMVNADEAEADMSRLYVHEARVDGGPYYRRWRPKDRGRAHPIAKRTSHIVVTVKERP